MPALRPALLCSVSALALASLAACAGSAAVSSEPSPTAAAPRVWPGWEPAVSDGDLAIASDDFDAGGDLPQSIVLDYHGCTGENVRPELHWDGVPEGTKSVVVTFTAEASPVTRWTIVDLPPDVRELPASAENPDVGTITQNSLGNEKMIGPCAAEGETWELWFTVYALDTTLGVPARATTSEVLTAGAGHVLEAAELSASHTYAAPEG